MTMNTQYIAIEGLDGTGKTQVAAKLSQALKDMNDGFEAPIILEHKNLERPLLGQYASRMLETYGPTADVNRFSASVTSMATTVNRLDQLKRVWGKTKYVVGDRSLMSTLVYAPMLESDILWMLVNEMRNYKAAYTFVLDADNTTLVKRLKSRGKLDNMDRKSMRLFDHQRSLYDIVRDKAENYDIFGRIVEVNTTDSTVDEVVNNIVEFLKY